MVVKSLGHNTVLTLDGFYEHPIRCGPRARALGPRRSAREAACRRPLSTRSRAPGSRRAHVPARAPLFQKLSALPARAAGTATS